MILRQYEDRHRYITAEIMATTPERYEQSKKMLCKRTREEEIELARVEREAIANFSGYLDKREAALGWLRISHHFG